MLSFIISLVIFHFLHMVYQLENYKTRSKYSNRRKSNTLLIFIRFRPGHKISIIQCHLFDKYRVFHLVIQHSMMKISQSIPSVLKALANLFVCMIELKIDEYNVISLISGVSNFSTCHLTLICENSLNNFNFVESDY